MPTKTKSEQTYSYQIKGWYEFCFPAISTIKHNQLILSSHRVPPLLHQKQFQGERDQYLKSSSITNNCWWPDSPQRNGNQNNAKNHPNKEHLPCSSQPTCFLPQHPFQPPILPSICNLKLLISFSRHHHPKHKIIQKCIVGYSQLIYCN